MARKTGSSKKAAEDKENKESAPEVDGESAAPETEDPKRDDESIPTGDVSKTLDNADEKPTEDAPSEESTESTGDAAPEGSAEGDADAAPTEEQTEIDTTVAGVVPARSIADAPAAPPPAPASASAPGAFPLVFGGLIAGAIGFLVATFAVPEGWPNPPAEVVAQGVDEETEARIAALADQISGLAERVDALPTEIPPAAEPVELPDLTPITDRLSAIEAESTTLREALAALEDSSAGLSARIEEVASQPAIVTPDGSAAMEAQLEAFRRDLDAVTEAARAEIEQAQARASAIEAEAAEAAAQAARNAALAEVRAALESGEAFAAPLAELDDAPAALAAVADEGVVPMSDLQARFPDAARTVLQEMQSVPEEASATDRVAAFLRRQTNARSLAPRDGADADAVLSRAEAALASGDLDAALTELEALPEGAAAAMQDWLDDARARQAALAAMNDMN